MTLVSRRHAISLLILCHLFHSVSLCLMEDSPVCSLSGGTTLSLSLCFFRSFIVLTIFFPAVSRRLCLCHSYAYPCYLKIISVSVFLSYTPLCTLSLGTMQSLSQSFSNSRSFRICLVEPRCLVMPNHFKKMFSM